jgi:hypothetical protein
MQNTKINRIGAMVEQILAIQQKSRRADYRDKVCKICNEAKCGRSMVTDKLLDVCLKCKGDTDE